MRPTLEELVEIAIRNQPIILERELENGVPLNYLDENGEHVLRYPDGHIEKYAPQKFVKTPCGQDYF